MHIGVHENTWPRKLSWDPWQWMWRDPYVRQGPLLPIHDQIGLSHPSCCWYILVAQTNKGLAAAKIWHTYHVPHMTIAKFWQQLWKQQQAR